MALRRLKMIRIAGFVAIAALGLAGCQTKSRVPGVSPSITVGPPLKAEEWKAVALPADEDRLHRLGVAWSEALAESTKSNPGDVRREGALLRPRSGLERPEPTPGSYYCRLIQLGRNAAKGRAYESFKPFFCYVEIDSGQLTLVKQTGSQRPSGRLWSDDDPKRMIFLGSMAAGAQDATLAYGDDPKRDMSGTFERIAPFKWRLVIPWPQEKSKLDVYELTPVANQPQ